MSRENGERLQVDRNNDGAGLHGGGVDVGTG